MKDLEMTLFEIISSVGTARSLFIEAIQLAKQGKYEEAKKSIEEGKEHFKEGHKAHSKLIQMEAGDEKFDISLILIHTEDQFMSAENFKILSEEFIDLYKRLDEK